MLGLIVVNLLLMVVTTLQGLPLSYWRTLIWDKKWELSTSTQSTWVLDQLKTFVQNVILTSVLMIPLYAVIRVTSLWCSSEVSSSPAWRSSPGSSIPSSWRRASTRSPHCPTTTSSARSDRIAVMSDVTIQGSFTMDASKRSTRDNAYVAGSAPRPGWSCMTRFLEHPQHLVEQVIAHELGHYRRRHMLKSVPELAVLAVVLFALTDAILTWKGLLHAAGVNTLGDPGSFVLFSTVSGLAFVGFGVLQGWRSRSREREADLEALEVLQDPGALIDTWRRMTPKNLQDLEPSLYTRAEVLTPAAGGADGVCPRLGLRLTTSRSSNPSRTSGSIWVTPVTQIDPVSG